MTEKITPESLLSLEAYHQQRPEIRRQIIDLRKRRTIHLGEHLTLIFENEALMRYQVQEMLRVERIFEREGIQDELDAYNPLVPDGTNFKVTMMIEYTSEPERRAALARMRGIENRMFVEVEGQARVYAIADEDLERSTEDKTSAVHFLRFELSAGMRQALKSGAQLKVGCDHKEYPMHLDTLAPETLAELISDLD